ncbi:glycoside hydrolase family 3 protein [Microbacterium mangrovi]|uniref:glycoside hydrolase family 3 protein n=1 Tax=Microbacterium mangrovi TaxID=1348253 RepID=UPI0006913E49|nr:glycoside hydrolase family 3 C-terminal domain-containing protein [Microbacterium mangrovi]
MTDIRTTVAQAPWDACPEVDARVEELVAQMTLDEKIAFVTGEVNWNYGFYARPLERLGLPAIQMADGPAGVRINKGDVHDGTATALPAPIALAATWDTERAREYGSVIGVECRATDHNVSLGPAVDIARVPLGGRTFESYGEDPLLASRMGVAFVRGVQDQGVQACAKHYAINNQEDHRSTIDAVIDERTMHELYLPPFEALIREAKVASMMASFNRINGEFACDDHTLLTTDLRDRFGFRGWIMSDYGANHSTAASANAGLDQEQPGEGFWGAQLWHAVQAGEVSETTLDEKVRRILRPLIGLGQIENPVGVAEFPASEHHDLAQAIAEDAMVLLHNNGVLPLSGVRRVALIGPDVDAVGARGGGSSMVRGTRGVSPVDGLRRALGDDVEVVTTPGSDPVTPGALLPGPDAVPSGFFATPDGERGLRAEFFANTSFDGEPLLVRTEGQIELNLGFHNFPGFNAGSPSYETLPTELNGQSSVRYTGTLTVPATGTYRFSVTALGRFSFSLDGVVVAGGRGDDTSVALAAEASEPAPDAGAQPYDWGSGGEASAAVSTIDLRLEGGRPYALVFEYAADDPAQGFLLGARVRLGWIPPEGVVSPNAAEAADLARRADVAVVVVRTYEAEADDRPHLRLPSGQDDTIRAVLATGTPTVVVLMTGSPVDTMHWGARPAALLQAWFPGQAQGDALARVLTGAAEPGGRLPLTFPASLADTPAASPETYPGVDGRVHYSEGVFVGYRGQDARALVPAYPFGHGLSYTTFTYSDLEIEDAGSDAAACTVAVTVRNVGGRAGSEVVQVYAGPIAAPVPVPPQQLAGFAKVHLAPRESVRVRVAVSRRAVSYYDVGTHGWVTPGGEVGIHVGASSRDIRLTATADVSPPAR